MERKPPVTAPAEIVEQQVLDILFTDVGHGNHLGTEAEEEIRTAADWAWVLFRDFFGEYPPTGDEGVVYMTDEDVVYMALVQQVLSLRLLPLLS